MRRVLGLVAMLLFAGAGADARAEEVTRLDRPHGVRFTLDGRVLTVRLVPQAWRHPPDVRAEVLGKRTRAACSPVFAFRRSRVLRVAVRRVRSWPKGQLELSYRFARDISDRVKWCLLEDATGGDIAGVHFAPFIRVHGETAQDRRKARRLRRYLVRQAGSRPWIQRVEALVVDRGAIIVSTDLSRNARGRSIARGLCADVRDSGVPSAPPGYVIYGRDAERLRRC